MHVSYVSACMDNSGYAEAARHNIVALAETGASVEVVPLSFESFRSDLGTLGNRVNGMVTRSPKAPIQIIHTTPNIFDKYIQSNKYNIGYTTWEATKLPGDWVKQINRLQEVWVPSSHNVTLFKNSGVTVPIHLIPHAFNRKMFEADMAPTGFDNISKEDYIFYSLFQWTERKNPIDLLKAYLTEFKANEKVCLILKTYLINPSLPQEKEKIKAMVNEVKSKLYLKSYPKVLLISSLLSKGQIHRLHKDANCYLSFHRDEGFGIPIAEAMMAGNPVICTGYGGPTDFVQAPFMDDEVVQTGYPISYQMTPCYGMPWETYTGEMEWADIDIMEARSTMRYVFNNRDEAKKVGLVGQKLIDDKFSWSAVGSLMKQRLESIK